MGIVLGAGYMLYLYRRVVFGTITRDDLRSRTGMVLQDPWLFAGSIRENIRYGRSTATDDEGVLRSAGGGDATVARSLGCIARG